MISERSTIEDSMGKCDSGFISERVLVSRCDCLEVSFDKVGRSIFCEVEEEHTLRVKDIRNQAELVELA